MHAIKFEYNNNNNSIKFSSSSSASFESKWQTLMRKRKYNLKINKWIKLIQLTYNSIIHSLSSTARQLSSLRSITFAWTANVIDKSNTNVPKPNFAYIMIECYWWWWWWSCWWWCFIIIWVLCVSSNGSNSDRIQLFLTPWNHNEIRETARMKNQK